MKKIENSFAVTGFVSADAQVRNFENTSVARFSISVSRGEKNAEGKTSYTSALLSIEAWRKNSNLSQFDLLKKGTQVTIEGYLKPEEWTDSNSGVKRSRIIFNATNIATPEEKETEPEPAPEQKKASKKKGK